GRGGGPSWPAPLPSGTTVRMVRSGPWEAHAVLTDVAAATLRSLPPPPARVLYLLGDSTRKPKRGRTPPWGHFTRHGEHAPQRLGCEPVRWLARWARFRLPR